MPQKAWNTKRERQYAHVKYSLLERGKPEPLAEEIAARVVNKERAQHDESVEASPSSINDMSAGRRGGLHSQGVGRQNPAPASQRGPSAGLEGALGHEQVATGSRVDAITRSTRRKSGMTKPFQWIGVGNGFRRPLPPNPVCGFPATGSPVGCYLIGIGAPSGGPLTS